MTTPLQRARVQDPVASSVQIVPAQGSQGEPPPTRLAFHSALSQSADRLFAVLEQSDVIIRGQRTAIEVYTVTDLPDGRWIQLSLKGSQHPHLITLHLPARGGLTEVASALEAWCADSAHADELDDMF